MKDLDFEEEDIMVCPSCRGAGRWVNFRGHRESCSKCNGTGEVSLMKDDEDEDV